MVQEDGGRIRKIFFIPLARPSEKMGIQDDEVGEVLKLRGQKLEVRIMNIAEEEEADEFIIGLSKSSDGEETIQSNIVRSVAGRLAIRAAEWGWRVYLHDEYGTTNAAIDRMINMGVNRSQQKKQDAYAVVISVFVISCF
ncbi:uncharacterized protein [Medicago truncatula]|uniref:uncharacterized protein n=1 Tax=Medicago truncatula TaxID=3880 RepID=UPI001966DF93|nr:uncharacterized protein LOC120578389 [Medicago truncatula]